MGISIYKRDIDTISDNINVINYKQKNIENVINTINDSVNTLKANCYGTTVGVMCFKLNNLKQQIESVNEYLTKYKQESQQVVDLYYQHCDGLNLDEDTLRNNISILNNKIDIYNNLSKPNKRLVDNATLQLDRNEELLTQLLVFGNSSESLLVSDNSLISNMDFESPFNFRTVSGWIVNGIASLYAGIWQAIQESQLVDDFIELGKDLGKLKDIPEVKFWTKLGKTLGYGLAIASTIPQICSYDWEHDFWGSSIKSGIDAAESCGIAWASIEAGALVGSWIAPPIGTVVGAVAGFLVSDGLDYATNDILFGGKSINDWVHTGADSICDWVGSWFS